MTDGTVKGKKERRKILGSLGRRKRKFMLCFYPNNSLGPNNVLSFILFCFEINKIRGAEREGSR